MSASDNLIPVIVSDVVAVNDIIKRFEFRHLDGDALPAFSGGAHIVVEMHDGATRRKNAYSLMSSPFDRGAYAISVRRDDAGRGGSKFMHEHVKPGMKMNISPPVNLFALDHRAKKHLMIAGGIGITPFIAQMTQAHAMGAPFELHYTARSASQAAYMDHLKDRFGGNVVCYCDDDGGGLDLTALLADQPLGTHVYVCGPKGMINAVIETATNLGWPAAHIHFEHFLSPPVGQAFSVHLARAGIDVTVGAEQSLLEAIEASGTPVRSMCRGGACGHCETAIVHCDGELRHNDHWLDDDQKASQKFIMPCVSRFCGTRLELDL
ncbi:PDR/VanB family oxidoreductase [Thalassospira lucentensis]|uniref:PDR/VanB family oxidoreductase n=1 Tax=Thalassospira lucentensis TaxID=168935 RepID=UPI003AA8EED1